MAEILGLKSLQLKLRELNKIGGQPFLRRVAGQGAAIVRTEARKIAPFVDRTGAGRRGIISYEQRAPQGQAAFAVGFSRKRGFGKARSGFYIKFIEAGTQRHLINRTSSFIVRGGPNKGTQRASRKGRTSQGRLAIHFTSGLILFRRSVMHPGIAARPFLVKALNASKAAIDKNTERLINEAAQRLAAGQGVGP